MTDDWKKTVHRNKLLGMWAAEKLGITGQDAEDYSDTLLASNDRPVALVRLGLATSCKVYCGPPPAGEQTTALFARRE